MRTTTGWRGVEVGVLRALEAGTGADMVMIWSRYIKRWQKIYQALAEDVSSVGRRCIKCWQKIYQASTEDQISPEDLLDNEVWISAIKMRSLVAGNKLWPKSFPPCR